MKKPQRWQRYEQSLDRSYRGEDGNWDQLSQWTVRRRLLTVIDEALEVVQHHTVEAEDIAFVVGDLPSDIAKE